MSNLTYEPYAQDEIELRGQELRAQQARARLLFHCYAATEDEVDEDENDDAYVAYYDEASLDDRT